MASAHASAVAAFIEGAPPGELADVINDVKALVTDQPNLLSQAKDAFKRYHEEQLTVVKLPGSGKHALVSAHTSLGDGRYFDTETQSSFKLDYMTQQASDVQTYAPDFEDTSLVLSLLKSFSTYATEHYPSSNSTVLSNANIVTILLAANKYSPSNFWNGRLRTSYTFDPSASTLSGSLKCDVHYYEDGNVRLTTTKNLEEIRLSPGPAKGAAAEAVVKEIAKVERKWQEELNRGFTQLSEGSFKSLRRQLPVTRQKMEWEKVGGLRVGREIGGMKR